MIYIGALVLAIVLGLGVYSNWAFGRRGAWGKIAKQYKSDKSFIGGTEIPGNMTVWLFDGDKWTPFNALKLKKNERGIYISAGLLAKPFLPSIFIPFDSIHIEGAKRFAFRKRTVLAIKSTHVKLALAGYSK